MGQLFKLLWSAAEANLLMSFIARIIAILNLPLVVGALMYAYEEIFGVRSAPLA